MVAAILRHSQAESMEGERRRGGGVGGYEWDRMTLNGAGGLGWAGSGSGSGWGIGGGMRWLCAKATTQELRKWFYL